MTEVTLPAVGELVELLKIHNDGWGRDTFEHIAGDVAFARVVEIKDFAGGKDYRLRFTSSLAREKWVKNRATTEWDVSFGSTFDMGNWWRPINDDG